tara:strand:- start:457 stop:1116 length:660 start_codon:yes stop_codon:yes gene_type:complete
MPTYRHKKTGERFLFVHIPRTGGRFFESNLKQNGWRVEQEDIWKRVDGAEVAHFSRELYEKYFDIKDIPHISIIRNPIERFFSASIYLKRIYGADIQKRMENNDEFLSMLKNLDAESFNWYRPQIDFLSEKTHVWKYEDTLGYNFEKWLKEVLDTPIRMDAFAEYVTDVDEGVNKLDKTSRLLDNVRRFCRKDIEQLYPELATPFEEGAEAHLKTSSTT